jgi:hypothetical protein
LRSRGLSGPSALKRTTQSRTICSATLPTAVPGQRPLRSAAAVLAGACLGL